MKSTKLANKKAIATAFGRAAKSYSKYNELQKRSANILLSFLSKKNERIFNTVLDAGCGPGESSKFWKQLGSKVTALDLSPLMLKQAKMQNAADFYLLADIESIPIKNSYFDLAWSHLAVQWCDSLSKALSELYRVTRPGGKIAFTTLVENSLLELSQAWKSIDMYLHVNHFLSTEEIKQAPKPYWKIRYYVQSMTLYFKNALFAMQSLKGTGATYLQEGRSSKIITRYQLQKLEQAWPKCNGKYPLTYQLFYGVIERD